MRCPAALPRQLAVALEFAVVHTAVLHDEVANRAWKEAAIPSAYIRHDAFSA